MNGVLYWIGAAHLALYTLAGSIYLATWLMHRVLRYLGLWRLVIEGLNERRKRERNPA